jgi:hypothetical protein
MRAAARRIQSAVALAVGWSAGGAWLVAVIASNTGVWRDRWIGVAVAAAAGFGTFARSRSAYNDAVHRTILLGQAVESAVDIHRLELLDALHWRRPTDPDDERALFTALASSYNGGAPAAEFRRWSEADETVARPDSLLQSIDTLPDQLIDSVRAGVRIGLREDLGPAVEQTLRSSLRGPVLDNYDGQLSVALLEGDRVVPIGIDHRASVRWGERHDLSVVIGPEALADGLTGPLRLRGGNDAAIVRFDVAVESNIAALRQRARTVDVAADRPTTMLFPLDLGDPGSEVPWIWVQISQRGRTMQSLEIILDGAGASG